MIQYKYIIYLHMQKGPIKLLSDRIDLHVHSNASDGTMSPKELVYYAKEKNIQAFALTDHDTIAGITEAKKIGNDLGIEVISGIEFSTYYNGIEIHILGLYIDENNIEFTNHLKEFIDSRNSRNKKVINILNNLGINITINDIIDVSKDAVITRAHIAKALKDKGYVKTTEEAFEKYLGTNKLAYVPREKITPEAAIKLTSLANGIPVLAHPLLYNLKHNELISLLEHTIKHGLKGIETIYSLHSEADERYIKKLANQYNLLITGGSDFHGTNKTNIDLGTGRGNLYVPYKYLDILKNSLNLSPQKNYKGEI